MITPLLAHRHKIPVCGKIPASVVKVDAKQMQVTATEFEIALFLYCSLFTRSCEEEIMLGL